MEAFLGGRCAENPRTRPPEGFPKSVLGNSCPRDHARCPRAEEFSECSAEEGAELLPPALSLDLPGDSWDQSSVSPMLRHSQVDGVEAEPVPDYSRLSFITPGSGYGSSSSHYLHWSGAKSCESETGVTGLIRACGTCRKTAAFTSKILLETGGCQEGMRE